MNLLAPFKAAGNFLGGLVRSRPDRDPYPVEEFPRDQEKMHGGPANIKLPAFLPYFDALQNVSETQVMRNAYRQMLSEPIVKAPTLTKIFAVASSELHLRPFGKKPNRKKGIAEEIKKYDRACEQAEFARWCLEDRLAGGVCGLVWSVLIHELMDGFSVSEKVWAREQRSPQYRSKWVLRAVKPKEVDNDLALVLDSYKNITGILGLRYNAGQTYDPRDFLISSHLPLFSTPTGMSDFRAAYGDYWFLDTCKKLRALGGEKRALPVVAGKYPDPTKQASVVAALKSLRNQNHIAVPKEVELEVLDIVGSADNYFKSWQADTQERIALAIAGATLQQMTGQEGAQRGDTKTHKDTADLRAWYLSQQICNLLNDAECGLLPDLIEPNFQEFDGFPRASMGGVDESELGESLKVDMGLQQMGFKHSTMAISDRYGREEAEDEDDELAPAPKEPPGGKGGGGGLGGMLAGLGGKGPDEGGGGKEPAKGVGKPTEPTEPTEAEAFAEWDESQHPRVGGKFARKMAHKEASKHLNRVNHLWTQRAPFWSDETAHAAIHPHVNDASGSSWSGDADDMAFRREAVGKLRAALHKEIAAGHRPGQKAILERMLHHTEAAHAALQGKPAEMAEDETAAPEQDPEELAALIADVLGGLLGEDALKAFEEEADKHAEGTKRKWEESLHPRGKGGRFIPRGSAEAVSTAHSALGKLMGGDRHPEAIREALKHLSILTVKQLHDLKRQHGLKASGQLREELIQKIAERLPGHKPAAKEEAKPVETAPTPEPAPPTPTPAPSPGRADSLRSHLRAAAALQNKERLTPEDNQRLASLNAAIEGHEAALGPAEAQKVYDSLQMGHEGPEQRGQQETKPVQPVTQTPLTPTKPRQLTPEQEQEVERRTQELMGRARELAGPAGQTAAAPPQAPDLAPPQPAPTAAPAPTTHLDARIADAQRRINELNAQLGPANQPPAVGVEAERRNQLFRELQRAQGDLEHYTALRKQSAENPPNPPLTSQPGLTKIESVAKPEAEKKGPEGGAMTPENQVKYNARHAQYQAEKKAIQKKYQAAYDKAIHTDDEDQLQAVEKKIDDEENAARDRFQADIAALTAGPSPKPEAGQKGPEGGKVEQKSDDYVIHKATGQKLLAPSAARQVAEKLRSLSGGKAKVIAEEFGYNSGAYKVFIESQNARAGNINIYPVTHVPASEKEYKQILKDAMGEASQRDKEALARAKAQREVDAS